MYMHVYMHMYKHVYVHAYMHVYANVHMYMYMYMYRCIYMYIYMSAIENTVISALLCLIRAFPPDKYLEIGGGSHSNSLRKSCHTIFGRAHIYIYM